MEALVILGIVAKVAVVVGLCLLVMRLPADGEW